MIKKLKVYIQDKPSQEVNQEMTAKIIFLGGGLHLFAFLKGKTDDETR